MRWSALPLAAGLASVIAGAADEPAGREPAPPNAVRSVVATREPRRPILTPESSPSIGDNLNGPSILRVPDWIESPLGRYYLYFAHHHGRHIRLAYADSLTGPWRIHEPGTLRLGQAPLFAGHVASPDVHVDHDARRIRMYFHGPAQGRPGQWTGVAVSDDGLDFRVAGGLLGDFHFRAWPWRGAWYAIAKQGNDDWGSLYRSQTGMAELDVRRDFLPRMRHAAVVRRGHHLLIFYSRVGDAPERILVATVDLRPDWRAWRPSRPIEVLRPETDYEGVRYPVEPSRHGAAREVRQLRDPGVFEEHGRLFLFYSVAGEMGIALAELEIELWHDEPRGAP